MVRYTTALDMLYKFHFLLKRGDTGEGMMGTEIFFFIFLFLFFNAVRDVCQ